MHSPRPRLAFATRGRGRNMVGAVGFEPTTFWSRTKRATKLRYAPIECTCCERAMCYPEHMN